MARKVPIAVKIFGISVVLLVLLVVLGSFTYRRTAAVRDEMREISGHQLPMLGSIAEISAHSLEQQILLHRIRRLYETEPPEREALRRELESFHERGRHLRVETEEAAALLARAVDEAHAKDDAVELARVETRLVSVAGGLLRYQESALELFKAREEGTLVLAEYLTARLEEDEKVLDGELEAILREVRVLTDRSADAVAEHEEETLTFVFSLVLVAVVLGLSYSLVVTLSLMRPVKALLGATGEVERGNLGVHLSVTSRDEIGELTTIFNSMVEEIREKERIKSTFGSYVDPRIVDSLLVSAAELERVERRRMSVFVSDVAGFSSLSELLTPAGLVRLINQYLTLATEPIVRSGGVIDQFIGDAVVAFWGPPFADARDHARLACESALEQFVQLERLRRRLPEILGLQKGLPTFDIRVGIDTGELVVGSVGSERSRSFTVLGPTRQVAEQLEGHSKKLGTHILLTERTRLLAADAIETRQVDRIRTAEDESVAVFELLSRRGELDAGTAELRDTFEEGFEGYLRQDWTAALRSFEACLRIRPDDAPASLYLERVRHLVAAPPGDSWDGVWTESRGAGR